MCSYVILHNITLITAKTLMEQILEENQVLVHIIFCLYGLSSLVVQVIFIDFSKKLLRLKVKRCGQNLHAHKIVFLRLIVLMTL